MNQPKLYHHKTRKSILNRTFFQGIINPMFMIQKVVSRRSKTNIFSCFFSLVAVLNVSSGSHIDTSILKTCDFVFS